MERRRAGRGCGDAGAELRKPWRGEAGPEDNFRPPLEGEVIDKGRAYFHSAPRADCVTGVFVIPGDFITVYKPSGEWLNVMYVARDGKETSGWLLEKRVRLRQAYGGPDEPAQP